MADRYKDLGELLMDKRLKYNEKLFAIRASYNLAYQQIENNIQKAIAVKDWNKFVEQVEYRSIIINTVDNAYKLLQEIHPDEEILWN